MEHSPSQLGQYEFILRSSSDGILIANNRLKITQVNPAASAMLGMPADAMLGKTPLECFRQNMALVNLFQRSGDQTLDVRLPRRRMAVGIATTLNTGERIVLLQDVTEKRTLEGRREALIKAIAHDLRNPIAAIGGFADLIMKFGELSPQQEKFAERIKQTASKLHEVIATLVELAWIEAGMPLEHVPLELGAIIKRAVQNISPLARSKSITIAISLQDPLPQVVGDPERMYLIFYHLLQNAVLYSEPENTVAIHAWGDEQELYCSVADRGFGIEDDELDRIFDRMYRAKDKRVQEIAGGGLGLTLARTIIHRLGGDIWASSNLGEGSTFTFYLPTVQVGGDNA